jgi:hypothetical protein
MNYIGEEMRKILLALILSAAALSAYSQTGVIRELTGEVELKHAGDTAFVPARQGSEIERNTIVSTGFRSMAIIEAGGTVITVRPLTRLTFAEISSSANTENLNVNLQAGKIRVDVRPPAGLRANTVIQNPSSVASVRGTTFEIDSRNLNVLNGNVSYEGANGFLVTVTGGNSSGIASDGSAIDPVRVAIDELSPRLLAGAIKPSIKSSLSAASGADPAQPSGDFDAEIGGGQP